MMATLIKRDVTLMARTPSIWLSSLVFFMLFLTVSSIAIGGDPKVLATLASALVWLAALFSILLSLPTLFGEDFEDGSIEQLCLSGVGSLRIVISRAVAFFLCVFAPLVIATGLGGVALSLSAPKIYALCLSLIFSAPALMAYGIMTAAIMAGRPRSGFLTIIMTAPFLIPVLIFGVAAVDSSESLALLSAEFKALAGISLIACAVGIPAAAAALSTNLE